MRLAWLSDIHLNFLRDRETQQFDDEYFQFLNTVRAANPDAIVCSGDIAEAPELCDYLERLETEFRPLPFYFVLGNHDFYRGSIARQREQVIQFCPGRERLIYLTSLKEPVALTDRSCLIGHDSWADGRYGAYDWSDVVLNDYIYIEELSDLSKDERRQKLNALGDEAAAHLRAQLALALERSEHVVLVMHVPPFLEACLYQGRRASPESGASLQLQMRRRRDPRVDAEAPGPTTDGPVRPHAPSGLVSGLPNVLVLAAKADYGRPILQRLIEVS